MICNGLFVQASGFKGHNREALFSKNDIGRFLK